MRTLCPLLCAAVALLGACSTKLPREAPPLVDIEEPLALREAPSDDEERRALAFGVFTGATLQVAQNVLDQRDEESEGLRVERIVENSPADAAGLEVGDLVFEVSVAGGRRIELAWPSEWRSLELEASAGVPWTVRFDRAGEERTVALVPVPRVRPADAPVVEHFREEQHVGVVFRTATEVEARAAGLAPGGGAVVIGLSRSSPWRTAGVRFGDLLVAIGERRIAHPQVALDELRRAGEENQTVELELFREGRPLEVRALSSVRFEEVYDVSIPLLYSFERERGRIEHSFLLGLIGHEANEVAYSWTFLWLITFRGGQSDRLVEVDR
ncbi:MAG: PDZ domain-containing protein [Planctomycetes bacterium]|nr:PDZ domain-containing protein [Planctomycetota bacterium]